MIADCRRSIALLWSVSAEPGVVAPSNGLLGRLTREIFLRRAEPGPVQDAVPTPRQAQDWQTGVIKPALLIRVGSEEKDAL